MAPPTADCTRAPPPPLLPCAHRGLRLGGTQEVAEVRRRKITTPSLEGHERSNDGHRAPANQRVRYDQYTRVRPTSVEEVPRQLFEVITIGGDDTPAVHSGLNEMLLVSPPA